MTGQTPWQPNHGPMAPVITLTETDYRFGAGPLSLAVQTVRWSSPQQLDGEVWYQVDGVELTDEGQCCGPRSTLIRASCLTGLRHDPRLLDRP